MGILAVHLKQPEITREHLGLIPYMLNSDDERTAAQQFDAAYQHGGGGWRPMQHWVLRPNDNIEYRPADDPDFEEDEGHDPPLSPIAEIFWGREERVLIYDYGWVCIIQPNGAFEVARMD